MKTRLLFPLALILSTTLLLQLREYRFLAVLPAAAPPPSPRRNPGRDEDDEATERFDEPYANRWQRKFRADPTAGNYLFFKHIRKAGGTSLRAYLRRALAHHGSPRTPADFFRSVPATLRDEALLVELGRLPNVRERDLDSMNETLRTPPTTTRRSSNDATAAITVHYAEQEFSAMDWQCPRLDPRWDTTLSVLLMRHPVERHLSEFFYSGPGSRLPLDAAKLCGDEIYRRRLRSTLKSELPRWLNDTRGDKRSTVWYFGRHYTDNFQLRALAGCSSGSCLRSKNLTLRERASIQRGMQIRWNLTSFPPEGACTAYFNDLNQIMDPCRFRDLSDKLEDLCPNECDAPCRYPAAAWGTVDRTDLARAVSALNGFDVVLLTETLDDDDQAAFLADVMGVPRNASFALRNENTNARKSSEREKTHFYRDLLTNLTLEEYSVRIYQENELEIELFRYAVELNRRMVERWKEESGWDG